MRFIHIPAIRLVMVLVCFALLTACNKSLKTKDPGRSGEGSGGTALPTLPSDTETPNSNETQTNQNNTVEKTVDLVLQLTPEANPYSFGEVSQQMWKEQVFTLKNPTDLSAKDFTLVLDSAGSTVQPFSLESACSTELKAGSQCEVKVRFAPQALGEAKSKVLVTYNIDATHSKVLSFSLEGNGTPEPGTVIGDTFNTPSSFKCFEFQKILPAGNDKYWVGSTNSSGCGTTALSGTTMFGVTRFNSDMQADTTLSSNGTKSVNFNSRSYRLKDMLLQSDGKILLAGEATYPDNRDAVVTRLSDSGQVDTGFGDQGLFKGNYSGHDSVASIALDASNKILLAINSSGLADFRITRLSANGSLDTSFGSSGNVLVAFDTNKTDIVNDLLVKDDKIYAVGSHQPTSDVKSQVGAIARLSADGTLDTTFSNDGRKTYDLDGEFNSNSQQSISSIIEYNGKLILVGSIFIEASVAPLERQRIFVARIHPDGELDTSFNNTGFQVISADTPFEDAPCNIKPLSKPIVDRKGSIVVGGTLTASSTSYTCKGFPLVRIFNDGKIDLYFTDLYNTSKVSFAFGILQSVTGPFLVVGSQQSTSYTGISGTYIGGFYGRIAD